jgi:tetrapyrrole methylase family protein/MazG family protein
MARLRSEEGGCPWDREQTRSSLKPFLIEECAEFLDALDEGNPEDMKEELGDILLQIVFHCRIAEEQGDFKFADVVREIVAKMIRRHPHVFGEGIEVGSSEAVLDLWQEIKRKEKKDRPKSKMDRIPGHFPALLRAETVQKAAASVGFNWRSTNEILNKIEEEIGELRQALERDDKGAVNEEIGDLLFAIVNLNRYRGGPPTEEILAAATRKFRNRFRNVERYVDETGADLSRMSSEELLGIWSNAKKHSVPEMQDTQCTKERR